MFLAVALVGCQSVGYELDERSEIGCDISGARVSVDELFIIAERELRKRGGYLGPEIPELLVTQDEEICSVYVTMLSAPGAHFAVWISRKNGGVEFVPGL